MRGALVNTERIKKFVGGQAVIEGVMMRGPGVTATAVREPAGTIVVQKEPTKSIADTYPILKKPFLRGCVALYESILIGMKALSFSAKAAGDEEEEMSNSEIAITMVISTIFAIAVFLALPTFIVKFIPGVQDNHVVLNLIEGVIRLVLFLLYIWGIGLTKDIQRVFQYHGAEHKTIHTYELDLPLTVENVRKQSRLHPRCGTNFLLIVMVVSIFVFAFLGWPNLLERIVSRVLLMPVVAGIAYEVIRLAGRSEHSLVQALIKPGLALQYMTTREPEDDQIEVAIRALEEVRPPESDAYEEE
ncbi:DUF1385 domain-containing protein [uncultured Veillonella sp.]|uniref:DUF1385 domain-containing protein n=1 Tax=uncultured Veillonella sp. TaxID=159268 RepID=UPI0025D4D245|nr:DUF1385 domain-containing protein [uncultured Veillonella sp.]